MAQYIIHLEQDRYLAKLLQLAVQNLQPRLQVVSFNTPNTLLEKFSQLPENPGVFVFSLLGADTSAILDVATRARVLYPSAGIIFTSLHQAVSPGILSELQAEFIPKPWDMNTLLECIQKLLNYSSTEEPRLPLSRSSQNALRSVNARIYSRLEKVMRKLCDHLRDSVSVTGAAIVILDRRSNQRTYELFQPETSQQEIASVVVNFLIAEVGRRGQSVLIEDIGLVGLGSPMELGKVNAVGGISFTTADANEIGFLLCFDTRPRLWGSIERSTLASVASTIGDLFRLRDSLDEITQRNDELNIFGYTIAQELKTPLNSIIAYADGLKYLNEANLSATAMKFLENILLAGDGMSDTITQLQWLSRLDGPLVTVHAIDANQVLAAALARVRYMIEIRNIDLEIAPSLPAALAHDMWMEEVFANLISNAAKFIGADNRTPRIRISGRREGRRSRYEIQDNGIGIAPEDMPLLFETITRLRQSDERPGLGLAIVKRIVNKLGGSVGVESIVGQGSTFWFTLPGGSRSPQGDSFDSDTLS